MSRTRIALALGVVGIVALSVSPAFADPSTNPDLKLGGPAVTAVQETLQDPVGEVKEVVTETTQKAEDIVADPGKAVEDAVDETTTVVGNTVDRVEETVGEVVGGGAQPKPDGPPSGGEPPVSNPPSDPRRNAIDRDGDARNDRKGSSVLSHRQSSKRRDLPAPPRSLFSREFFATAGTSTIERAAPRLDVAPITPREAAEKLAFPLLITLAMAAFLLLQGRFDRRDPKLVLQVDVEGERLAFE